MAARAAAFADPEVIRLATEEFLPLAENCSPLQRQQDAKGDFSEVSDHTGRMFQARDNLFAYHLPLDAHPELGNNAQLGLQLGLLAHAGSTGRFGEQELGFLGARENGDGRAAHLVVRERRPDALIGVVRTKRTLSCWSR